MNISMNLKIKNSRVKEIGIKYNTKHHINKHNVKEKTTTQEHIYTISEDKIRIIAKITFVIGLIILIILEYSI